ncbi:MAG: hypothetical protein EBT63_00745 [Proteobacteria bacterium]|nr:hypothetical protein [Pseudomonadota bacterium]NCA28004.1 hypothetical protein [Pseudomonadota bacterium]
MIFWNKFDEILNQLNSKFSSKKIVVQVKIAKKILQNISIKIIANSLLPYKLLRQIYPQILSKNFQPF